MRLTVRIEPSGKRNRALLAYVLQPGADGQELRGKNLLTGCDEATEVETAKRLAMAKLKTMWRGDLEIEWQIGEEP